MTAIRAFIAIELPLSLQDQLGQIITDLQRRSSRAVRWVTPRNIHLTLKFLGNVSPANLGSLTNVIGAESLHHKGMQITVGGLGAFPNRLRPRVVWVGVQAPQTLLDMQRGIDRETSRLGYPNEEREFSPHLTLGRVSQHATPQEVKSISEALGTVQVGELGTVSVQQIWLYKSDLQTGGAVYTPLFKAPLAAAA